MTLRWTLSLIISVALHLLWVFRPVTAGPKPVPSPQALELIVAKSEPVPARPLPQPQDSEVAETSESQKFRPNTDPPPIEQDMEQNAAQAEPAEQPTEPPAEPKEEAPAHVTEPLQSTEAAPPDEPQAEPVTEPLTKEIVKERVQQYREQLAMRFHDQYAKIPELHTIIQDLTLVPEIDRHFGMVILAYSFVDHKPGPPFILFDDTGPHKTEQFNFDQFSNRVKDRMLYTQYRQQLKDARQDYKINALMKVIGLVPMESDRYFSAKQLRAIELAKVTLAQVQATHGHYESDGFDGFNLIIDTVVTTDGRTIPIQDEELAYSVVNSRGAELQRTEGSEGRRGQSNASAKRQMNRDT
jgi:hypothetical protein